jgi:hypothetical protein
MDIKVWRRFLNEGKREVLNEENELLKAQDACKAAMFKIKPSLDKFYKKAENLGYIDSYTVKIEPYNNGFMLKYSTKPNYRAMDGLDKTRAGSLYIMLASSSSIVLQPDSFFEDKLGQAYGENTYAFLNGNIFQVTKDYKSVNYKISNKNDIKTMAEKFVKENEQAIKLATNMLDF